MKGGRVDVISKPVDPKLVLIAAVDQSGLMVANVYNRGTSSVIFGNFLYGLAEILEKEDPNFRTCSIILLDNAAYHGSRDVRKVIRLLQLPVMFLPPYTPDFAPIELIFNQVKTGELNQEQIPTGKR